VKVHSFKEPTQEDLDHDYLWRYQRALPERGQIGIFNRSHYEEVLVVRVHPELLVNEHLPEAARGNGIWDRRFREINDWERYLVANGIRVVKVHLNLSRREQAERFLKRIERPEKNWKFSMSDIREREHWDDYQAAFEKMLTHTSTDGAPWYVVPADHKWFARLATAAVLVATLADIDPQYPRPAPEERRQMMEAAAALRDEIRS
jgi:PPK2 family polyphosphate:nucleotide phosphotransferase